MNVRIKLNQKQYQAYQYLTDKETTEIFFGGGAGGGKSYLGCFWIVLSCIKYPGIRCIIGRAHLKTLRESTLLTFFKTCKDFGLISDKDYKYSYMQGKITFENTSEIYLKDLYLYPSDPEFDSLGSTEYTLGFIDEVSEISEKSKNIVMSRLRYKLDEFGLMPKLLLASNPSKNFAYREYWKPWKESNLPIYRKFIPALVGDNQFISDYYAENLKKLDKNSMQRLLYGNLDYDDDPSRLFDYDRINDIFHKTKPLNIRSNYFISADIARFGSDKSVVIVWDNLHIEKIYVGEKQSTEITKNAITHFANTYGVPIHQIVIDEDGIGGGIVDQLHVQGFVNNSKAYESLKEQKITIHNFANLKTQCYVKLSEYVNENKIGCEQLSLEI